MEQVPLPPLDHVGWDLLLDAVVVAGAEERAGGLVRLDPAPVTPTRAATPGSRPADGPRPRRT